MPASLLLHARALAAGWDESLAQVVRRALRAYVAGAGAQPIGLEAVLSERAVKRRQSPSAATVGEAPRPPQRRHPPQGNARHLPPLGA
jgi:hypothetical protein